MTTGPDSAGAVLEQFIGVLTGFEADVLMPLLGPDPVLEFPYAPDALPRQAAGRADSESFWQHTRRMFREMTAHDIVVHEMVEPGLAMATWRSEAITAGKPREYRNTYVSLARVEDGLVNWYCEYFDPMVADPRFSPATEHSGQRAAGRRPVHH